MILRNLLGWLRSTHAHGLTTPELSSFQFQMNGMSLPVIMGEPLMFPMLVVLAVVWLLPHTPLPSRFHTTLNTTYHAFPSIHVDYHPTTILTTLYPQNKTALYLEPRPLPYLTPLLLHMLTVIPPSWNILFVGSSKTVDIARSSHAASRYEELGKLRTLDLESGKGTKWSAPWGRRWDDLSVDEMGNRLLTNLSFYEEELAGVGWLLVWHSDAILCANAERDLEEWVGWDWVGAPWAGGGRFGGNGGLSIRNVEKVKEVLRFQKRLDNTNAEDQWLSARLGLLPNANMCPPETEREFAVEDVWHEWPMGYHVNPSGFSLDVWGPKLKRKQIFEYCPEIKIILDMRLEREKCFEMPEIEIELSPQPEGLQAKQIEVPTGSSMSKEEFNAQFGVGEEEGSNSELEKHIKELEEAMAELTKGGAQGEEPKVEQELGDPEIADFAHVQDFKTDSDESESTASVGEIEPTTSVEEIESTTSVDQDETTASAVEIQPTVSAEDGKLMAST